MTTTLLPTTGQTGEPPTSLRSRQVRRRPRFAVLLVALMATIAASLIGSPTVGAQESEQVFLVPAAGGLVLDVHSDVEVFAAEPDGSATQRWTYELRSAGELVIRNVGTGRCLEVPYSSDERGLGIIVWDCNGNDNQVWKFSLVADGLYALTSVATGLALELPNNVSGTRVAQQPWSGSHRQQWGFAPVSPHSSSRGSASSSDAVRDLAVDVVNDVAAYWTSVRGEASSVNYVVYNGAIDSGCGSIDFLGYCPADDKVFLPESETAAIVAEYGGFALAVAIATLYGDNVQFELGLSTEGKNRELQADCFAGAWAADANRRGRVAPGDINNALELFGANGGERFGTGQERRDAVLAGWMNGPGHCVANFR